LPIPASTRLAGLQTIGHHGPTMKQSAVIAGVGITRFGKHQDRSLQDLAREAIGDALADSGISAGRIEAVWAGNAAAAVMTGQVCIAGQAILRSLGVGRVPVVNVENACATAATAFHQAASMVTLGAHDVVLAFGVEKLYSEDKQRVLAVFDGCADVEHPEQIAAFRLEEGRERSVFMDVYARWARDYMAATGATADDFAAVVAKNARHGSMNPNAQFLAPSTAAEVLASGTIVPPLTLMMCSPIADGAAAALLVSERAARELGVRAPVRVRSSVLASGYDAAPGEEPLLPWVARRAYDAAGVGPGDLDCVELHDAAAPAELICCEAIGLCPPGEAVRMLHDGATRLGGSVPVNTSGGLVRKGHPIGATGLGQIHELVLQLRDRAGARQVEGAHVALAENGGGFIQGDSAAVVVSLLSRN
jgi:acetyl-CoA acetyltransferase